MDPPQISWLHVETVLYFPKSSWIDSMYWKTADLPRKRPDCRHAGGIIKRKSARNAVLLPLAFVLTRARWRVTLLRRFARRIDPDLRGGDSASPGSARGYTK